MHEPVHVAVLEDQKVWGMIPRELADTAGKVSWLLALGFGIAAIVSGQWWFLAGSALAVVNSLALQALASYLRELAYANADLLDDQPGAGDVPRE
ncbi:hypothetical protein [Frigoribacterium sp. PvP032]|uniref:hypothetical protein n=1 Tax=Frigoribacterium sp. PvP032 TaxID=2806589 RepID=UPI001AE4486A|nr:hypothetical protein [Frigoribacterium sp. PvP032]MBP1189519.1 hypothetical protein [Frigoribacterium sp. PvP032]